MKTLDIIQGFCDHVFVIKRKPHLSQYFVGKWEADLLEVTRSRLTYEYEVKVSRCDFHKDKRKVINMARTSLMLSLPANVPIILLYSTKSLIKPDEVPDFAGLIYAYEGSVQCYSLEREGMR